MFSQIPLGIELKPRVDFSGFIIGRNGEAVSRLRSREDPLIHLWGAAGCGKSHLLQAACAQESTTGGQCAYLPLTDTDNLPPTALEGLEDMALVCLDDLQQVAGDPAWERALFNLFNQLREHDARLLTTATTPPARLPVKLPDLASRLTWGPCYHLIPLDDNGRLELLMRNAQQRGLELTPEIANFLLQRTPRNMHSLTGLVEQLDQASLAAQRRLTIPFVRKVLEL